MSMATSYAQRAHEENWLPVLELAIEEVFEIMLGCKVKPTRDSEVMVKGEFTAMIGLAGALCGILTICCSAETARQVAQGMLGDTAIVKTRYRTRWERSATWSPGILKAGWLR